MGIKLITILELNFLISILFQIPFVLVYCCFFKIVPSYGTMVVIDPPAELPPIPNILKIKLIIFFGILSTPLKILTINDSKPPIMDPLGAFPDDRR